MTQLLFNSHSRLDHSNCYIHTYAQCSYPLQTHCSRAIRVSIWMSEYKMCDELIISFRSIFILLRVFIHVSSWRALVCFDRCWNFDDTIRREEKMCVRNNEHCEMEHVCTREREERNMKIEISLIEITIHDVCLPACTQTHTLSSKCRYVWPIPFVRSRLRQRDNLCSIAMWKIERQQPSPYGLWFTAFLYI